jgi:hypothetical protein
MKKLKACVTFDVDFTNYFEGNAPIDEFRLIFPYLVSLLNQKPELKVTWFIRLDAQIEAFYGKADFFFTHYKSEIDELRNMGHEIGWHPHCYTQSEGVWKQNTDVSGVLKELSRCASLALDHGMESVRMGWGFHTNETIHFLANRGFAVDCSAIPRPKYAWEETNKDWSVTPCIPYFPYQSDYRISREPALSILEVPMSVANIEAPYDTGKVLRCVNLAYHPNLLKRPLQQCLENNSQLITVTHPYELFPIQKSDALLAFNLEAFEQNLITIHQIAEEKEISVSFCTLGEFAITYKGERNAKS